MANKFKMLAIRMHTQSFLQGVSAVLKNLIEHQHALACTGGGEYTVSKEDIKRLIGMWQKTDFQKADLPPGVYEIIESYLP